MKTILTIIAAIAFVAMFVFCEGCIPFAFVSLAVWATCSKVIEKYYLTKEEKEERV